MSKIWSLALAGTLAGAAVAAFSLPSAAQAQSAAGTLASQSAAVGQNIAMRLGELAPNVDPALLEAGLRAHLKGQAPTIKPDRAESVFSESSKLAKTGKLPAGVTKADLTNVLAGYVIGPSISAIKDDVNLDTLFASMRATMKAKGKGALNDEQLRAQLQAFNERRQQAAAARNAKLAETNRAEGAAFLAKNKAAAGVQTTASGLQYVVVRNAEGQRPNASQKVRVHYEGRLLDGTVFDSSYKRNQPAEFGLQQVIKGWTEGVALMPVGSKYRFFIPSELAYGATPRPGSPIGPNAVLVFDVELLAILPN